MITKQLKIAIFLIFASTTATNSEHEHVETLITGRYNFNHPPNVEDYNPIPVDVVYDKETVSARYIPIENDDGPEFHEDVSRDVVKKTTSTNSGNVFTRNNNRNNKALKAKKQALDDLQIPVAVIYDRESEEITNNNKPNLTSRNRTGYRGRIPRGRPQPISKGKGNQIRIQKDDNISSIKNPIIKRAVPAQTDYETQQAFNEKNNVKPKKRMRERDPVVPIIESENYVYSHSGNFHYSYEGGDGTRAFERGELKTYADDSAGESVVGGFSYTDKDGNDFSLSYTADENGYRPVGAHLPTPPPIPPAIARALLYLSTKSTSQADTESSTSASSLKKLI